MRRIAVVLVLLGLSACGGEEEIGTADLALTGQAPSGRVFRLRDGVLDLLGDGVAQTFRTEDDPVRTSILAPLRAGAYRLTLSPGWRLEQVAGGGRTIAADLASANPLPFTVEDGATSLVRLRFVVDGEDVPMTGGAADIGVAIEERDAATPDGGLPPDAAVPPDAAPSTIAVHVSPLGVDSDPGTSPDRPVLHVQVAIDRAALCVPAPCEVRIAQGTYVEAISLASGVAVTGGFRGDFAARDPRLYPVILTSVGSQAVAARGLRAETRLEDVTVRGADLVGDTTGASSYGIAVSDSASWLSLRRVRVELGRGGRGRDGDHGLQTECAIAGGEGGSGFDCGARAGQVGAPGDATGGTGGNGGTSQCTSCPLFGNTTRGLDGVVGAIGGVGSAGTPADDVDGNFVADRWAGALGVSGTRGGHGGGGGGGGAGGTISFAACSNACPTLLGGHGGAGGAGGCGGGGGASGGAGGGAFGIVIAGSSVVADRVDVIGGGGGAGGRGGDGHPGTEGAVSDAGRQEAPISPCSIFGTSGSAGGHGARGGRGGRGGGGPGGVGGPVIGTALVGGGLLLGLPGSVTYAIGSAGGGGPGGTGFDNAPAGVRGIESDRAVY